jgi:hypothetical protein
MPTGACSPEISAAFNVAPEVVYAPIVPSVLFATKIVPPCARRAGREGCEQAAKQARRDDFALIKGLHRSSPDVLRQSAQRVSDL